MIKKISIIVLLGIVFFIVIEIFIAKKEELPVDAQANILGKVKSGLTITSEWIKNHLNTIVIGATGTGKTYIVCSLGDAACKNGFQSSSFRCQNS